MLVARLPVEVTYLTPFASKRFPIVAFVEEIFVEETLVSESVAVLVA